MVKKMLTHVIFIVGLHHVVVLRDGRGSLLVSLSLRLLLLLLLCRGLQRKECTESEVKNNEYREKSNMRCYFLFSLTCLAGGERMSSSTGA